MAHSNGIITVPAVDLVGDVAAVLGVPTYDTGYLCGNAHGNIKKWSKWKPVRFASVETPSNQQMANLKFGIDVSTARHTTLENAIRSTSNTQPLPANVGLVSGAYAYLAPTGGDSSPYRLLDFADDPDTSAPAGLQFNRQYDHNAEPPDDWDDWTLQDTVLQNQANIQFTSNPAAGIDWTFAQSYGIVYTNCSVRFGVASNETVGATSSKAMPLTYLFGNNTITTERWRIGLAVYLPYGVSATSTAARWMVFAGRSPLAVDNRGACFPSTASNVLLCQGLWYNYNTKKVTQFTIVPCILLNSQISVTSPASGKYVTQVVLDRSDARLLLPPNFKKCTLTISASPIPGQAGSYTGSIYRGLYSTNITSGTYKIQKTTANSSGGGTSVETKIYRVTIPSGVTISIAYNSNSAYNSSGHLQITTSGSGVIWREYENLAQFNKDTPTASGTYTAAQAAQFFYTYTGVSATNVTLSLDVTKIS